MVLYFLAVFFVFFDVVIKEKISSGYLLISVIGSMPSFFSVVLPAIFFTTYKKKNKINGIVFILLLLVFGIFYEVLQNMIPSRTFDCLDLLALFLGAVFSISFHVFFGFEDRNNSSFSLG